MSNTIPFFELFSAYIPDRSLQIQLLETRVEEAVLKKEERVMEVKLLSQETISAEDLARAEKEIATAYSLQGVHLQLRVQKPEPKKKSSAKKENKEDGILLGKAITDDPVPIPTLNLKMGRAVVYGRVFAAEAQATRTEGLWRLSFDMTDEQGSVRVMKFMNEKEILPLKDRIQVGMWLLVEGRMKLTRDGSDMQMNPSSINLAYHSDRMDDAPQKRVELHLHTRMSNMDALTDTKEVVKTAIRWGHQAIAITDHGVAQAFPDAASAAGGKIKILYGIEAYFVNNLDDRLVVHGKQDVAFGDEIVCFDIETTGLSSVHDAITEIGAVVLKNGEMTETFQTFVAPGRKLRPEIIGLTGITDSMLENAPQPADALQAFLKFVAGRPLSAHNAEFDIGFIREGCKRAGLPFEPTYIDSLILAQNLLPELNRYKLDNVADYLKLPAFNHHRASDDGATVGYMLIPFFKMLKERGLERIQQINDEMLKLRPLGHANRRPRHMIILAKNKLGMKNMYQLISASNLKYFKSQPIIPKTELNAHREGLIIGSACEAGELFQAVIEHKSWDELKRIASFYDYLEIQPICNNLFMLRQGKVHSEEDLRDFNRTIIRLGEELGKMVVATGDVHFLNPGDEDYRHILLAGKKYKDADSPLPIYFKTTNEMLEECAYLGEEKAFEVVVTNPNRIADMVEDIQLLPKGQLFPPRLQNSKEDLYDLVWGKAHELYGETLPQIVQERLDTEMDAILGRGYDVIYMSAQKLVQRSLENGYLVGSRGSVGSSLVAYMSGITEVNSLPPHYRCPKCKHSEFILDGSYGCGVDMPDRVCPECGEKYVKDGFYIPFETFLGFGGDKVPDIDLNFSGEYQARAHRHAIEMFGETQVFRAGTIGTLAEKTAFGYVMKYLEERGKTVGRAEENRLTQGIVGVRRTTGQHPGGLVVVPDDKDIEDFCPVQHPADDTDSDTITTHFEYHCMEDNLLKLDMLGHDDPTIVRMLEDLTGVNAREIPLDDADTMSIFISSKVLGFENDPILGPTGATAIPEFGTRFVRGMLVNTKPTQFDTLVRISGFSHGTDVWLGNAQELIASGQAGVNEVIGCRDDIMIYLMSMGLAPKRAFKFMENVRKGVIHKGKSWIEGIEEEMREHAVPEWYIDSCKKIQYLFPKAHAVAYVTMAFRIAWFKVHHPLAFYATYFTIRAKAFDAAIMTAGREEVERKIHEIENNKDATANEQNMLVTLEVVYEFYVRGFHFEPINIYKSEATRFAVCENGLIPPFVSVHGLGEAAAIATVEQRAGKEFLSVEEFTNCCTKLSKSHIDDLRALGAFAGIPDTSQICFFG